MLENSLISLVEDELKKETVRVVQADPEGMQNFRRRATSHLEVVKTRKTNHLATF